MKTNTYKLYDIRTTLLLDNRLYFRGVSRLYYTIPYDMRLVQFKSDPYLGEIPNIERDKMTKYKVINNEQI